MEGGWWIVEDWNAPRGSRRDLGKRIPTEDKEN